MDELKRRTALALLAICCAMAGIGMSAVTATSSTERLLVEGELSDDMVVARVGSVGSSVRVTVRDVREYMDNIVYMEQWSGVKQDVSPQELVERMLKRLLVLEYAARHDVAVSDETVQAHIRELREALSTQPAEMQQVSKQLADRAGVTEEQYWSAERTLRAYREMLTIQRTHEVLTEQGIWPTEASLAGSGNASGSGAHDWFAEKLWAEQRHTAVIYNHILRRM